MARPSLKNGFTRIHNELIERALCKVNLSSYEYRILWAIVRLSWGWNKRDCYSSYRELSELTGIDARHVQRTVKTLETKLIIAIGNGSKKSRFEVNTDYMTWNIPEKPNLFNGANAPESYQHSEESPIACRDNGKDNKALSVETTPAVVCRDNARRSGSVEPVSVAAVLKKFFKDIVKETEKEIED